MNAGFSNLATIKALALPQGLSDKTQFNTQLLSIGLTAAGAIARYCGRKFDRLEDAVEIIRANNALAFLERYPMETLTSIEVSDLLVDGEYTWQDSDLTLLQGIDPEEGALDFGCFLGTRLDRIRLTYTGGYFWEQLEPFQDDGTTPTVGYPTTVPAGANLLPDELVGAWASICAQQFQVQNIFEKGAIDGNGNLVKAAQTTEWPTEAKGIINSFRRLTII